MKFPVALCSVSVAYTFISAAFCLGAEQPKAPADTCTGLCLQQTTCANTQATTTYVPNGAVGAPTYGVTAFTPGVQCGQCGNDVSGSPLVSTRTAFDGTFSLGNMPVGTNIPLVIQIGRWRRRITIANVPSCVNTALSANSTRLPINQTEGDIPLIAVSTGSHEAVECVLRKIGIDDSQFSNAGGTGRIRFYTGEGSPGAQYDASTPSATTLFGSQAEINQYDMVLFACQGNEFLKAAADQQRVINYVNAGGRVFATHFSYVWLSNVAPFSGTAAWQVSQPRPSSPATGYVNTSFARGQALAQWLQLVGASTTSGQIQLGTLSHDFNNAVPPAALWLTLGAPATGAFTYPMQYSFDTPVGSPTASQCGRVVFNDYHVEGSGSAGKTFPAECTAGAMTPQEKLLEFTLFDLDTCMGNGPQVNAISHTAAGHAIIVGNGSPSSQVTVQSSPDLITPFIDLGTATADGSGNFSYDDGAATVLSKRFYRLRTFVP